MSSIQNKFPEIDRDQWQSMVDALEGTQLKAEKAGILIYAENRFTGHKIFPGETYNNSTLLAQIATSVACFASYLIDPSSDRRQRQ